MNVHESEKIAGVLESMGYLPTEDNAKADIIVYNTCCIRDTAEKRALGNLSALKSLKRQNPELILGICGCLPQQKDKSAELRKKYPYIDIILGTNNIAALSDAIRQVRTTRKPFISVNTDEYALEEVPVTRSSGTNAWVNIMQGCNNFCTYCIVPYVRGRERSRAKNIIVSEIKDLISQGYKEITLLGQNVDSYRYENDCFADLLEEVANLSGKFRLRFMSSHPKDFNQRVIDIIKNAPNICNSIHLPLQSGSDKVLKDMNRKYTMDGYYNIVNQIRAAIPNAGITTDIMVGFPGESDKDFENTLQAVENIRFSNAFTFVYSPRKGTVAAEMPNQVPESIKKERIMELIRLQNKITKQNSVKYIGNLYEVLCEDYLEEKNQLCGRTDDGRLVTFNGEKEKVGQFVQVKIERAQSASLFGISEENS